MVLSARPVAVAIAAAAAAAIVGVGFGACMAVRPAVRLPTATPVALAFALAGEGTVGTVSAPAALGERMAPVLAERNLVPPDAAAPATTVDFGARPATPDRLARLAEASPAAAVVVLVESTVSFYAQIEGRYRWTVRVRATVARRAALGEAQTEDYDLPIVLRYDHQREVDALTEAAPQIAARTGALLDRLLAGGGAVAPALTPPRAAPAAGPAAAAPAADAIYFVLVDRFVNGDRTNDAAGGGAAADPRDPQGWHGGDLAGLRSRLGDLEALGVTTIWLSPVFAGRHDTFDGHGAFHGYWVTDHGAVDPRFGDAAALVGLGADLRRRGMRLLLDVVVNHVAWDAPLRRERPDWFHTNGPIEDWNDATQLETHDVHGLPDLAVERADVQAYLLGHARRWIERVRPDGFRLDAVRHVPLPVWRTLTRELHAAGGPGFELLGEVLDGSPAALARTFEAGFDTLFDFPLAFALVEAVCDGAPAGKVAAILSLDREYADPTRLVTLVDNHDLPRVASRCGGDLGRVGQALDLQLTARGTPSITYGTEAGLEGAVEPQNRADMRWSPRPLAGRIRALLAARRAHPALRGPATLVLRADAEVAAWARLDGDEAVVVALNLGRRAAAIELPAGLAGARRELIGGGAVAAGPIALAPRSTRLVHVRARRAGGFAALAALARRPPPRTVEIVAEGAAAGPGDTLVLVGGGAELGRWDPARAPRFPAGARPTLRLELPAPAAYGVKLALRRADGTVAWQDGADRILFIEPAAVAAGGPGAAPERWTVGWQRRDAWRRSSS